MRTRDKKSFPTYSGKIIQWKHEEFEDGKIYDVMIVAADYDIGYTLVNPNDHSDKFTCINGPLSPHGLLFGDITLYDKKFQYLLDCVRNNKIYTINELIDIVGKGNHTLTGGNGVMMCAFSS